MVNLGRGSLAWTRAFLGGEYFAHCSRHPAGKNERNHFCLDCIQGPICNVGLHREHAGHRTLQVRRASHMDAVRVSDIQKFAEVSDIQTYTINGAKIVFLLSRPQYKATKGAIYCCRFCNRTLSDPANFCSISCKSEVEKLDPCVSLALQDDEQNLDSESSSGEDHHHSFFHVNISELPLKKRRFVHDHEFKEHGHHGSCASGGFMSGFMPRISVANLQSPQHSETEVNPITPVAPCTPPNRDFQGFRLHHRKGFPHRSPFQ